MGLEQVRRRGRWRALGSVQRYTKVHDIIIYKSGMPIAALQRGVAIMENPVEAMLQALAGGDTPVHRALRSALSSPHLQQAPAVQASGARGGGDLAARTVAELNQLCKQAGLAASGNKHDLIERL